MPDETRDLVARLRATGGKGQGGPLKAEAADEIERLRAQLARLEEDLMEAQSERTGLENQIEEMIHG